MRIKYIDLCQYADYYKLVDYKIQTNLARYVVTS